MITKFKSSITLVLLLSTTALFAMEVASSADETHLAILISGTGTNMAAILDRKIKNCKPCIVISNRKDALGLQKAKDRRVPTEHIPKMREESREDYCARLIACLKKYDVTSENGLVCLAGFMIILGSNIVKEYNGRILNVHPALLPSFKGGHGIKDAYDYGVKFAGPTVHFVDEGMDTGQIVAQEAFAIEESDSLEDVEVKMHAAEHRIYPAVVSLFVQRRLYIEGRKVRILPDLENYTIFL